MTMTVPRKTTPFKVIASGKTHERVPRVSGYHYYALPFLMDETVDWAEVLAGIEPRATLISVYPEKKPDGTPHPKAGKGYPTDVTKDEDRENFVGVLVDGFDYETDLNVTVQLQGALELKYIQSSPSKPWGQVDPIVKDNLADMGITLIKGLVFWDSTRKALK